MSQTRQPRVPSRAPTRPPIVNPLLTVPDVAQRLSVSEKTVRRLISSDALAKTQVGRCLRVSEDDLQAYLVSRRS